MAEEKVKLYGMWGSPFSKRVEIALKMKGVEYEYFEEDIHNKSPQLLLYSPVHKKVPVLVHRNKAIAESQVIIEYIDETWDSGTRILPRDPYQRALARFWARFLDDKILPLIVNAIWHGEDKAMEEAKENMKILDKEMEGKRYFGGESVGFVDIVANLIGYWLDGMEEVTGRILVSDKDFPSVCKWQKELVTADVIRDTLPPRDKLLVLLRGVRAQFEATNRALESK